MGSNHRLAAVDHLRGIIVALVVLHHSVLAYCRFGYTDHRHYLLSTAPVVDAQRWGGFDVLATLNDSFFMPLMFLLSGLFVWRGLQHRGAWGYLGNRMFRLGAPFAAAVLTIVPVAYYPSWLQAGGAPGFLRFWFNMVTAGPWPSGPPWFIAVLLAFDASAALAFMVIRRRVQGRSIDVRPMPCRAFALLLPCLLLAYLPLLILFGPSRWLSFGPLAIQASRIGLYGVSFAAGIALGASWIEGEAVPFLNALILRWPRWALLTLSAGTVLVGTQAARLYFGGASPSWMWLDAYGIALTGFCSVACFAVPAICLRFAGQPSRVWGSLAASSYGIYLVHYPVVTWMQFGLLKLPVGAITKAGLTFAIALLLSWALIALSRRRPGARAAS